MEKKRGNTSLKELSKDSNSAVLIICRDIQDLPFVHKIRNAIKGRVVIASDDLRVHEAAARLSWIDNFIWTEKKDALYSVANDVIN